MSTGSTSSHAGVPSRSRRSVAPEVGWSQVQIMLRAVKDLAAATTLEAVMKIVRTAARQAVSADGATFVLRDNGYCFYADEDAITPLWKGARFPMTSCVSGWAMLNKTHAAIEDIYIDPRIPLDAYRPTFVKSLVMMPIRSHDPIGSIGVYWAKHHRASAGELELLQGLADSTAVAMANLNLRAELDARLRTIEVKSYELTRYVWLASHDLKEPLRMLTTYLQRLQQRQAGKLDGSSREYLGFALEGGRRLQALVDDLLLQAHVENAPHVEEMFALDCVVREICDDLAGPIRELSAEIVCDGLPEVRAERILIRQVLYNLITNALKFRRSAVAPRIELSAVQNDGEWHVSVSDNGIGISAEGLTRVFGHFERLHPQDVYPGSGLGLALCKRIVEMHGGKVWASSREGEGSTFSFSIKRTLKPSVEAGAR